MKLWQICPKCEGQGIVSKPPYVPAGVNEWSGTAMSYPCNVCGGNKIIQTPEQYINITDLIIRKESAE